MPQFCINCGYNLSTVKFSNKENEEIEEEIIIKKKPKKVVKVIEQESEEEQDPKEIILKKVAERLVMKNGKIDIKNQVTEKQKLALQKMREGKLKKKQEQGENYVYSKVEAKKINKAKALIQKAEEAKPPAPAPPKQEEPKQEEPKRNNNNNFYNIF